MLWVAPVEHHSDSGVKCAHLPRSIWDARVVWYTGNVHTNVMIDVRQCPGCCIGPRECTTASDDRDGLDMPGFMKTIHNVRGLKLDEKNVWLYECSGQRIALGDYGNYSNGNFKPDGNIFEDMRILGIDPGDPAYRPVVSRLSRDADVLAREWDRHGFAVDSCLQGEHEGRSLPNNQGLVLLLKALSTRLSDKHLVTTIIQCSVLNGVNGLGGQRESQGGKHCPKMISYVLFDLGIRFGI
ncbi:hypothetical protein BKA82DRAFT_239745 [Pisolithus tinctorius]|nr:hypothetical protein BKA82DRAFT_239745 [Pisolithus tinctorius]